MYLRVGMWGTGEMAPVALTEDLGSGFQQSHDSSQLSITPVPKDPAPSLTSTGTMQAVHTYVSRQNVHT